MTFFCLIVLTYFIGAIPSGVWLGKIFKNIDVRDYGSKNSGATNSYRVLGAKLGTAVLIMDVLKGFIPLYIASKFNLEYNDLVILGLVAILAHTFSCFISFKGGKGVATFFGCMTALSLNLVLVLILCTLVIGIIVKSLTIGFYSSLPLITYLNYVENPKFLILGLFIITVVLLSVVAIKDIEESFDKYFSVKKIKKSVR